MMSPLAEQILQTLEVLHQDDQQQILDFVEFLQAKRHKAAATKTEPSQQSFLDVAQSSIGAGESPGDLSTNPAYMKGYGQ